MPNPELHLEMWRLSFRNVVVTFGDVEAILKNVIVTYGDVVA